MHNDYYVYHLIDPSNDIPFYVGKGRGRRIYQHEILAKAGKKSNNNGHLFNKINKVLKEVGFIKYKFIFENLDKKTSTTKEIEEIRRWGRADMVAGPLCNLTDGGEGSISLSPQSLARKRIKCAYPKSPEHRQKLSIALTGKIVSLKTIEKLKNREIHNQWNSREDKYHSENTKYKMGLSRKGKSWEEIYGVEEAKKMREKLNPRHSREKELTNAI